jgi:hypothetical protein
MDVSEGVTKTCLGNTIHLHAQKTRELDLLVSDECDDERREL